jgi:hypothetical protein
MRDDTRGRYARVSEALFWLSRGTVSAVPARQCLSDSGKRCVTDNGKPCQWTLTA